MNELVGLGALGTFLLPVEPNANSPSQNTYGRNANLPYQISLYYREAMATSSIPNLICSRWTSHGPKSTYSPCFRKGAIFSSKRQTTIFVVVLENVSPSEAAWVVVRIALPSSVRRIRSSDIAINNCCKTLLFYIAPPWG